MTFLLLLSLGVVMFTLTIAAGLLSVNLSEALARMPLISALSLGILVGTALAVVLPEGVKSLAEATYEMKMLDDLNMRVPFSFLVGASLLAGFMTMSCIGHWAKLRTPPAWSTQQAPASSTKALALSLVNSTTTLSLLVHAFVDGIPLGAAVVHRDLTLSLVSYLMIVIHKIPTAFSLAPVLLNSGLASWTCKAHLVIFALATPISSLLTFMTILIFDADHPLALGMLFLFSAGTFLYSVVHVFHITELAADLMPALQTGFPSKSERPSHLPFVLSIVGMILPLFLSLREVD